MKSAWNMTVPVISTAHLPAESTPQMLGLLHAEYDDGFFIWIGDDPDNDWEKQVRDWMYENYPDSGSNWVRFDSLGVQVDLPVYEWS